MSGAGTCPSGCRTRCPTSTGRVVPDLPTADGRVQRRPEPTEPAAGRRSRLELRPGRRPLSSERVSRRTGSGDAKPAPGDLHRARPRRRPRDRLGQGHAGARGPPARAVAARARDPRRAVVVPLPVRQPDLAPVVARELAARRAAGAQPDGQGRLGPAVQVPDRRARRPAARVLPDPAGLRARRRRGSAGAAPTSTPRPSGASRSATDARRVLRDLHVNGWVLAFEGQSGKAMRGWRGPRESRLDPPRRKVRGEWIPIRTRRARRGNQPQAARLRVAQVRAP